MALATAPATAPTFGTAAQRRWVVPVAVFAALGSFGVYYVFTTWLDVLLPTGRFGI